MAIQGIKRKFARILRIKVYLIHCFTKDCTLLISINLSLLSMNILHAVKPVWDSFDRTLVSPRVMREYCEYLCMHTTDDLFSSSNKQTLKFTQTVFILNFFVSLLDNILSSFFFFSQLKCTSNEYHHGSEI